MADGGPGSGTGQRGTAGVAEQVQHLHRATGGEIWKLEDCIYDLISQCEEVLSDKPLFFAVNSYTTGLSPAVMEYMLKTTLVPRFGGKTSCDEIGLPVSATGGVVPCGATAIWEE